MINDATRWEKNSACCNDSGKRTKSKGFRENKYCHSTTRTEAISGNRRFTAACSAPQKFLQTSSHENRGESQSAWVESSALVVLCELKTYKQWGHIVNFGCTSACSVGCSFCRSIITHKASSHFVFKHGYHVSCFNLFQLLHIHCPWRASGWRTSWWRQPSVDISCTGICWHPSAVHLRFQLWYCLSSADSKLNYQLLHFSCSHAALRESIQGLFQGWSIVYLTAQLRLEDRVTNKWHPYPIVPSCTIQTKPTVPPGWCPWKDRKYSTWDAKTRCSWRPEQLKRSKMQLW